MGVDYVLFERLVELSTRFQVTGRSLGLGRHTFRIESQFAKLYEKALRTHGREGKRFDYLQNDGYYETLMQKLGFGEIESMDFSDYEGANVLHDLSKPIPEALEGQFVEDRRAGVWRQYRQDGSPSLEAHFQDGVLRGQYTVYGLGGEVVESRRFSGGEPSTTP